MNLNVLEILRNGLRTFFCLCIRKIEIAFSKEVCDLKSLSILRVQLTDKFQRLDVCQNAILEQFSQSEDGEHLFKEALEESETYRDRYLELCVQIDTKLQEVALPNDNKETRKFKLPKMELKKFNGEAKEYLTFWSQFQKIHDDKSITDEEKMQYLLQSMEPKSNAERLVLSFPATAANYPKAIEQLKELFGREDLLVQNYVRDLLSLVMKNAATGRAKTDLPSLYDELEGKLRALENLGRTQEKYGDFLTPLVESCLPEEVLVAWERSRNHDSTETEGSRTLEHLMNFLRQEVKGGEADLTTASALVSLVDNSGALQNIASSEQENSSLVPKVEKDDSSLVPVEQQATEVCHPRSTPAHVRYCCNVCKKGFSHKSLLDRHMAKHTGERRFPCSVCNSKFKHQGALLNHMRRLHKDSKVKM